MPENRYPHVARTVAETPWALLPSKLKAIIEMVSLRADGHRLTDEEVQARIGAGPARRETQMAGPVAVLPIYGVITPRADLFSEMSGGTSVQRFQSAFRDAVDDKKVSAIVLDIDSPGGSTDMVPELAAEIRAARGSKPIIAVANTMAASAAYWLAAQADEVVVTPSGEVGSVGVFAAHTDISGAQEKAGVKTTLVSAGRYKVETNPFEPLSDEARAAIQERVDEFYGMFVADVAKGRGVPEAVVRDGFGQGRVVTAETALAEGMVDRIATYDDTVSRLMVKPPETGRRASAPPPETVAATPAEAAESGLSFADEARAVRESADALVARLTSLAEVERGRLTAAKREALSACPDALRAAAQHLDGVLAATDPNKHVADAVRERARFERMRANL